MKLALSAGVVALSMALAGCGGSSSSGGATNAGDRSSSSAPVKLTGIPSNVTFTEAAFPLTIMPGKDEEQDGVTFSCPSTATSSCMVTLEDNVASGTGGVMARAMVVMRSATENTASVRVRGAITQHSPSAATAFGDSDEMFRINGIEVERYAGDAEIELEAAGESPNPNLKFEKTSGAGSMGQAFTYRSTGTDPVTERVVVYTNIDEAGEADWTATAINAALGGGDAVTITNGVLEIAAATGMNARHIAGVVLPDEVDSDTGTNSDPAPAALSSTGAGIKGSLFGVEGTFKCETACNTIVRDQDGRITVHNGTPSSSVAVGFTPTAAHATDADIAKIKAKYVTPDPTYAVFGYWAKTPSKAGEAVQIETFARPGPSSTALATAGDVAGKATYNGAAAGWYSRVDGDDTYSGDFTANASLTATFGAGTGGVLGINAGDQGVTGTISGFRSAGDTALAGLGWSLTLNKAKFRDSDGTGTLAVTATDLVSLALAPGTTDGGSGVPGAWQATFAGNSQINEQPSDIVGQFNGSFRAGRGVVAGAFGASRQQ